MHYTEWDFHPKLNKKKHLYTGVACTGVWRWPAWVNKHPARKLVLSRDVSEVNKSLRDSGLPELGRYDSLHLPHIKGMHVQYEDLFDQSKAEQIWAFLVPGIPFNEDRHEELVKMWVQPAFDRVSVDRRVTQKLMHELETVGTALLT